MELTISGKAVCLAQLSDEIRSLPGLSRVQGLSACGPSSTGETVITLHVEGPALSAEEERSVREAVARHVPDPQWGVPKEESELTALLNRSEGSLSLGDVEKALRALARAVERGQPGMAAAAPVIQGG